MIPTYLSLPGHNLEARVAAFLRSKSDAFWLYPALQDVTVVGGKISAWVDHLGGSHNASQASSGARPTVGAIPNGRLGFAANTAQSMLIAGAFGAPTSFTFSIVYNRLGDSGAGNGQLFGVNAAADVFFEFGAPAHYQVYDGSVRDSSVVASTGVHTVTYVQNGNSCVVYCDGITSNPFAIVGKALPDSPAIFGDASNTYGINAVVSSIVYAKGASAALHALHRSWGQLMCGAP